MTETILSSPFFGLTLTCAAWCIGLWVQKRTGLILCNPLVVSSALIILSWWRCASPTSPTPWGATCWY